MAGKVKPIPEGYHTVTPYLIINGAADALEFYKKAFGATELFRMPMPDGTIGHAEIKIGDSHIMLGDEPPAGMGFQGPKASGNTSVGICLYVEDVDAMAKQAVATGAKELRPVVDQFYGDRSGTFQDPFGHDDLPGAGQGFVSVFDTNGNFQKRLISGGALNSPWGIALAPRSFGNFHDDLLIGNFGDGRINAYDISNNRFLSNTFMVARMRQRGGTRIGSVSWGVSTPWGTIDNGLLWPARLKGSTTGCPESTVNS